MADTTIRIPAEVRDRLAELAADENKTIGQYVASLSEHRSTSVERKARSAQARAALAEHFDIHLTDEDIAKADEFVRNIHQHAETMA